MDVEALFRRRLRELITSKFQSLDRFYLETGISKGHVSEILRGKGSPSISTLQKIAVALDLEITDLFIFPERGARDEAHELLRTASPEMLRRVIRILS
jgi:transcriptional regulator with XRE-family HTH domain